MMNQVLKIAILVIGTMVISGCGEQAVQKQTTGKKAKPTSKADTQAVAKEEGHGWWCEEHGVKEEECSMCQKEVFKKLKPDEICPKHPDRAKAQCFICNPELWVKSKAIYRANYGKEPPEPKENLPEKK